MTTAVGIPITDHSRLHRKLTASVDLIDLGETMCNAGSAINSAGRHVMMVHEMPTELMLSDIEFLGMNLVRMVNLLRLAGSGGEQ